MGIAPSYVDLRGITHQASAPTLQAVIAAMGLAADDEQAVADSIRAHDQGRWSALVEPTTVCWVGDGPPSVVLRRPLAVATGVVDDRAGARRGRDRAPGGARGGCSSSSSGPRSKGSTTSPSASASIAPCPSAPTGSTPSTEPARAPGSSWSPPAGRRPRAGVGGCSPRFTRCDGRARIGPRTWVTSAALADWVADLGGHLVATLPLLATFDGEVEPLPPRLPPGVERAPPATSPISPNGSATTVHRARRTGDLIDPRADACRSRRRGCRPPPPP